MHISPCGWYCFQIDTPSIKIIDTQEKTELHAKDNSYIIELLCARKDEVPLPEDICQLHEDYLIDTKVKPQKSVLAENEFGVQYYLTRSTDNSRPYVVVTHLFWGHYCLLMHFAGDTERYAHHLPEVLFSLLQTIQPLTWD